MDALKAEIATKRKAIQDDARGPSKYMRRGDLERLKAEKEQKAYEDGEKPVTSQVSTRTLPSPPLAHFPLEQTGRILQGLDKLTIARLNFRIHNN